MLCSYCKTFDYDELTSQQGYRHHTSWEELVASAKQGCSICQLLKKKNNNATPLKGQIILRIAHNHQFPIPSTLASAVLRLEPLGYATYSELTVCTDYNKALGKLIASRPIYQSALPESYTAVIKGWLERCDTSHSCLPQQDHILPCRVIDVGSDTKDPKLVITSGRTGRWVALSHCWGLKLPIRTDSHNINQHCKTIPLSTLTANFRDAILITRGLGFTFLWIDALCIIQDSIQDWYNESLKMSYVYENAVLTIAAEASEGSKTGIFASTQAARQELKSPIQTLLKSPAKKIQGTIYVYSTEEIDQDAILRRGPLSQRCWAMQEEILSPRIVRFSTPYMTWRCTQVKFLEWDPENPRTFEFEFSRSIQEAARSFFLNPRVLDQNNPKLTGKDKLLKYWYTEVVNFYIGRHITYKNDKLIAIYGVAKKLQESFKGVEYLAGIWADDIHRGLAWETEGRKASRHNIYVAPSWSWAQLEYQKQDPRSSTNFNHQYLYGLELFYNFNDNHFYKSLVRLVNSSNIIFAETSAPVEHWTLSLEGLWWDVCSCKVPEDFLDERTSSTRAYRILELAHPSNKSIDKFGLKSPMFNPCLKPQDNEHQKWTYFLLGRRDPDTDTLDPHERQALPVLVALILRESAEKDNEMMYERVGRALIPIEHGECLKWPKKIFKLI